MRPDPGGTDGHERKFHRKKAQMGEKKRIREMKKY